MGLSLLCVAATVSTAAEQKFETDVIKTSKGDLTITFIGHASLMMSFGGKNIYVDPTTQMADYSKESNELAENPEIWGKWMIRHARDF